MYFQAEMPTEALGKLFQMVTKQAEFDKSDFVDAAAFVVGSFNAMLAGMRPAQAKALSTQSVLVLTDEQAVQALAKLSGQHKAAGKKFSAAFTLPGGAAGTNLLIQALLPVLLNWLQRYLSPSPAGAKRLHKAAAVAIA